MDDNDWIHPICVSEKFKKYDYHTGDDYELKDDKVEFSYYYRPTGTIVPHTGKIVDWDGREDGIYWIEVEDAGRCFRIHDIGVVRSPARNGAHLGPLTALKIGEE